MFTRKFLKDLFERSVRTFFQGAAAFATLAGLDVIQADIKEAVIGGAVAGAYAVLTSLGASQVGSPQTASLLDDTVPGEAGEPDPQVEEKTLVPAPARPTPTSNTHQDSHHLWYHMDDTAENCSYPGCEYGTRHWHYKDDPHPRNNDGSPKYITGS